MHNSYVQKGSRSPTENSRSPPRVPPEAEAGQGDLGPGQDSHVAAHCRDRDTPPPRKKSRQSQPFSQWSAFLMSLPSDAAKEQIHMQLTHALAAPLYSSDGEAEGSPDFYGVPTKLTTIRTPDGWDKSISLLLFAFLECWRLVFFLMSSCKTCFKASKLGFFLTFSTFYHFYRNQVHLVSPHNHTSLPRHL